MRLSEFRRAVVDEFGDSYGDALVRDLVLDNLGDLTAQQALVQGIPARKVWQALCLACDVPQSRQHGVGLERGR